MVNEQSPKHLETALLILTITSGADAEVAKNYVETGYTNWFKDPFLIVVILASGFVPAFPPVKREESVTI